jgi:hypothetical protein
MKSNQGRDKDKRSDGRGHLTASEISCWLVEGPSPELSQHLDGCFACQAKLAEAQEPLTAFRTALVDWSEAQGRPNLPPLQVSSVPVSPVRWGLRGWLPVASLAMAVLLLVGFVTGPDLFRRHGTVRQAVVDSSISPESDTVLMDQVDTEVSEAVPDAMAPLTDLVAWDSREGVAQTTAATEKNATHKKSSPGTSAKAHAHTAD